MQNLVSQLDLSIITSTQIVSLECCCTHGHFGDSGDTQKANMVTSSGVVSRRELALLDGFYSQSRERTNVLIYGTLPV